MTEQFRNHRPSSGSGCDLRRGACGWLAETRGRPSPPPYKRNPWSPWRPQRSIPSKQRQAERIVRNMRELASVRPMRGQC